MIKNLLFFFASIFFLVIPNKGFSQSCISILANQSQNEAFTNGSKFKRRIGIETEVYGNQIENITNIYSEHFGVEPSTGKFLFRTLNDKPKYTLALISEDKSFDSYEIHSDINQSGDTVYYLFISGEYDNIITQSASLDEIKLTLAKLISIDGESLEITYELEGYQLEEIYTWEVTFINSDNLPEMREVLLINKKDRSEVLLFLNPAVSKAYIETGLIFSGPNEAFSYVNEFLKQSQFYGRVTIPSPFGNISIIPESSASVLVSDYAVSREDFATEIVFPPTYEENLVSLLEPFNVLSQDDSLLPNDPRINLGMHINIEFDPSNLKDIVHILLKLNKEYENFRRKYQQNSTRLVFAKPLPLEAVAYLEMLSRSDQVTYENLAEFLDWLPDNPKTYWLNIAHIIDPSSPNYRPAVEVRIADSTLDVSKVTKFIAELLDIIEHP